MKGLELEQLQSVFVSVSRHIYNHAAIVVKLLADKPSQLNPTAVLHDDIQKNQIEIPLLESLLKFLPCVEYLCFQFPSFFSPLPYIIFQLVT